MATKCFYVNFNAFFSMFVLSQKWYLWIFNVHFSPAFMSHNCEWMWMANNESKRKKYLNIVATKILILHNNDIMCLSLLEHKKKKLNIKVIRSIALMLMQVEATLSINHSFSLNIIWLWLIFCFILFWFLFIFSC